VALTWIKAKYIARKPRGKYHSDFNGRNNAAKPKHPLTDREKALHAAQPVKVLHILASGKGRMEIIGLWQS
jgi:hypothetical protein